jgi:hypothetical protein
VTLTPVPADDAIGGELLPARADTDSWIHVVREVTILAQQIAGTEFVPKGLRNSIPATAAAMLYGREVGLPPMTALSQIHVVEGRPGLSAEGMRALVLAAGHEIVFDESTSAVCRIRGRRHRSATWTEVEWTIDLARRANLLRRGSAWENYPRDMLVARATTALCRMIFPDVIHGFRSIEELGDMSDAPEESASSSPAKRATVSRRSKSTAPPTPALPTSAESPPPGGSGDPATPPPHREPSLPGESEGGRGDDGDPPSPPPVPPGGPDYPVAVPRHAGQPPVGAEARAHEAENPDLVNRVTLKLVFAQLRRLGLDDTAQGRDARLDLLARLTGRDDLGSANDLSQDEGTQVATILSTFRDRAALDAFLAVAAAGSIADVVEERIREAADEGGTSAP